MLHTAVPRAAHGGLLAGWSVQHQCRTRQHPDAGDKLVNPIWSHILAFLESRALDQALVLTCTRQEQMLKRGSKGMVGIKQALGSM